MVKVNGIEVQWEDAPNFKNDVKRKILWRNEETGATFALMMIPKGTCIEEPPHSHPHSNQFTFMFSGEMEFPDGTFVSFSKGDYRFAFNPKNDKHGPFFEGQRVPEDVIYLHYWDGPDNWDGQND